jgi:hypothetical protein
MTLLTPPPDQRSALSPVQRIVRDLVPYAMVPLCLVASLLSAAPWLRSFPTSLAGAPMYGAAVLSVLVALVVVRIRPRWLWLSVLVDAVAFTVFTLVLVLREPLGFDALWNGLLHGPSQILTYALPLVSPRSLMVAPVALVWLAGALAGECLARRWYTLLPYLGFLIAFGLSYAATQRAAGAALTSTLTRESLLAAALLVTLLLLRVAQAWVRQDQTAESTQADGVLPLRGLVVGVVTTLVIAVVAALAVRTTAFPKRAVEPQRVPSIDQTNPLTPVGFVSGLRPRSNTDPGRPVFTVTTDKPTPGYFSIANVDFYDGAGWSFDRTFRPSGGVLPVDTDPALQAHSTLTQQYRIAPGPLAGAPWMPFVYRAQRVTGAAVNIDPGSGMIVPAGPLAAGTTYTMRSGVSPTTFDRLKARTASPDTATSTIDTQLPGTLRTTLDKVIQALSQETHTPTSPALPFLQALQRDLQAKYTLSNAARAVAKSTVSATPSSSASAPPKSTSKPPAKHHPRDRTHSPLPGRSPHASQTPAHRSPTAEPTPTPAPSRSTDLGPAGDLAGGTGFADVLASILGTNRSGTPEQFATLLALIARDLGVPARVVTGFRVEPTGGAASLPAGRYDVTTADAWTWAEIPVNGVGWVVLDGAPAKFSANAKQTESGAAPPSSSSAPPSQNALITQGGNGNAVAPKGKVPHSTATPTHALVIALAVAIGVLLVLLLVVLLSRKRLRAARRRRVPDPRLRVVGAWQESLDRLAEAGLADLSALTSAEVAARVGEQFGPDVAADTAALGSAADAVTYSSAPGIDAAVAEDAWRRHRNVRTQVGRRLGLRGRLAAGLRYRRIGRTVARPVSPASWDRPAAAEPKAARTQRQGRRDYEGRRRSH